MSAKYMKIVSLTYPQNRFRLALLSISAFQTWYMAQNPRELIFLAQDPKFKRFIFWAYVWKVNALRSFYKVKRFCLNMFLPRVIEGKA